MGEEFKCPSCGGTASIVYYRAGNNLLYCHDCQKAFSEVGAKIMKQAARIAELEKMAEARKLANCLLEQERNELEAECVRLREALERVVKLLDRPMLKVDMCLYMDSAIRVAREALKGAEE